MSIEITSAIASSLVQWILDNNPKGDEDIAQDIKSALCDLVDNNTMSRRIIEKRITDHLRCSYDVRFSKRYIEVYASDVTMQITGGDRSSKITLDTSEFDYAEEISRLAGYAEEMENAVWDDDVVEELIKKWFELEA